MMTSETCTADSILDGYRPTAYLIGPEEMPISSIALYRLVCTGFALGKVEAMVASSPLYGAASVLDRILGDSSRRRQRQGRGGSCRLLNARQSAAAFQFAQTLEHATVVFGSQRLAEQWLGHSCKYLAGYVPLEIIDNWWGFRSVDNYLQCIEFGVYH